MGSSFKNSVSISTCKFPKTDVNQSGSIAGTSWSIYKAVVVDQLVAHGVSFTKRPANVDALFLQCQQEDDGHVEGVDDVKGEDRVVAQFFESSHRFGLC